ncbi:MULTISPECIES: DUF3169 family protein [unclassified Staphylococcus]|uniref:DUF3169 family protein n=1 Tax=unclassified Staphylococcus TaxID=91994 RepID=UPI0021CE0862|nr:MULTISPECIES: DUF3169 family protein [unclassified Staphylococcus]UXR78489.1 DUF3169 family protein [Staphylococcus sp. IVB6227]UXR82647.1 DUF3169 family protein [Staphylococcus sp. IVB6214]
MKVMRFILSMLFGGLIGGFVGLFFADTKGFRFLTEFHFVDDWTMSIIGYMVLAVIAGLFLYQLWLQKHILKKKKEMTQTMTDVCTETDQMESRLSLLFWRVGAINQFNVLLSFIFMIFAVLNNSSSIMSVLMMIIFVIASFSTIPYSLFVRKYDVRFPKVGEKQYTEKVLALMDEGERHITLVSMYKVYTMNSAFLMIGILLLSFFSIESGVNQSLGLIILVFLFAYNIFGYLLRVRKFYK